MGACVAKGRLAIQALLVCLVLSLSGVVAAKEAFRPWTSLVFPPVFEHISVEHGLSQSTVHSIVQDKHGFLWMGTDAGLNRYDGFRFQVFHPQQGAPDSLAGDWIEHLLSDRQGRLWIAARNAGLTLLDTETLRITRIPVSDAPGGLPELSINAIVEDKDGVIWLGTEASGLVRVTGGWKPPALPRFERLVPQASGQDAPLRRISTLFVDGENRLWVASPTQGLGRLRGMSREGRPDFEFFPIDPNRPDHSCPAWINAMTEDHLGLLWLGTDRGLFLFDPSSGEFSRWTSEGFPDGTGRVIDIFRDAKDAMWVAGDGQGLFKASPRRQRHDPLQFEHFRNDPKNPTSLSRNGVQSVFEDASDTLWVGAYQGGLNKLALNPSGGDRERPSIYQYRTNAADPWSLSGDNISSIGEDRFGNLWVGTDGFGLNRLAAPKAGPGPARFERFRKDPMGAPGALAADVILTMHRDPEQRLWMGSFMGGLIRVDQTSREAKPTFTHFKHDPKDPQSLSSDFIRDIVDDGQGGFWIACDNGGGLNHYDPRTRKGKRYLLGEGPRALRNANLMRVVRDHYGTLWIASQLGLHRFNPSTEEFRVYPPGAPGAPSDSFINTLYLEPSGTLWIGTRGGGLNRTEIPPWDGPAPRFAVFGLESGLPANSIQSILPDGKGNLWLTTPRVITRFDTRTHKAYPFTYQRELRRAEFIWNAAYRGAQGELFFGSNDGLTVFHPDDIVPNPVPPVIAFTGFQVRNQPFPLRARLDAQSLRSGIPRIVLGPDEAMFSLEFAALHFSAPDQNQYAYRLDPLDTGWNEIGNRHSVTYTALPPGNYTLSVRATNCDGVASREDLRLNIRMLPPWHATWWFRTLLALALGLGIVVVVRIRMSVLKHRNRQLRQLVDERTQELARVNEALRNQSFTDPLTGLRNRRLLDSSMPEWVATVERQQRAVIDGEVDRMSMNIDMLFIMIDVDHFKQVNDLHGHLAGDRVLQQFGEILQGVTRTTDTVARWGGEEFLVVARNAARADATTPVERIRKAIEDHAFDIGDGQTIRCTCSLGFSVFPLVPGDTALFGWEQIVSIADVCLYSAKHSGRNGWVGLVPLAALPPNTSIPRQPSDLVRASCFTPISSFAPPLEWGSDERPPIKK